MIEGNAVIPAQDTLRPYAGMTGYDGIRANLSLTFADDPVRAFVLDIASLGGEVPGCFDLIDAFYVSLGTQPVWALLTECAYSAAYALASACDRIIVPCIGGTVIRINLHQLKEDFYRDNVDFTNLIDLLSQCVIASKQHFLVRDETGKQQYRYGHESDRTPQSEHADEPPKRCVRAA